MKFLNEKHTWNLGLISILTLLNTSTAQASERVIIDQLKSCAQMEQETNRFECYEQLGKSVLGDDVPATVETVSTTPSQTDPVPAETSPAKGLPDSLGGGDFDDRAGRIIETNRGRVTSCKKASDRKWFYVFENGQVWKQVDSRKRRHKNCDFMVTITKDSFGYKMVIDGQDSKIRIDRRR